MEDDDTSCPLCMEDLDVTDRNFRPCPCGYQVCLWCYHHIRDNLNGQCPACRRPYEDAHFTVDPSEIAKLASEKKQRDKQEKRLRVRDGGDARPKPAAPLPREQLGNVRVIQRTLVYVVGLSPRIAREDVLRRPEFFGQFGRIVKVAVNAQPYHAGGSAAGQSLGCYITYSNKDEALNAILAADGVILDGRTLRAQFGTTKYCAHYIRHGTVCANPECMFLHEIGDSADTFSKEEMGGNGNRFHNETHPATSHKAVAVHTANGGRPQVPVKHLAPAMQSLLDAFGVPNTSSRRPGAAPGPSGTGPQGGPSSSAAPAGSPSGAQLFGQAFPGPQAEHNAAIYNLLRQIPYLAVIALLGMAAAAFASFENARIVFGVLNNSLKNNDQLSNLPVDVNQLPVYVTFLLVATIFIGVLSTFVSLLSRGVIREKIFAKASKGLFSCCMNELMTRALTVFSFLFMVVHLILAMVYSASVVALLFLSLMCAFTKQVNSSIKESSEGLTDAERDASGGGPAPVDAGLGDMCSSNIGPIIQAGISLAAAAAILVICHSLMLMSLNSSLSLTQMERKMGKERRTTTESLHKVGPTSSARTESSRDTELGLSSPPLVSSTLRRGK
eukprot:CAMPEP_0206007168 /NCGR_PEP_ID=MMETSP1464-20131121/5603_1 /ASSEMBLY_ACC=CAM_ASM_001124 /TAXON_ID=119497 /ORGANISM="Exanthemachrysis gayraliae, Strain RCC1523" /LENGTH=612 /DNA_ID=CAMNT_0053380659 /DNA_START=57 /DNA_END=1896 /DNA_ORIENTATION=-